MCVLGGRVGIVSEKMGRAGYFPIEHPSPRFSFLGLESLRFPITAMTEPEERATASDGLEPLRSNHEIQALASS
jgi:hypothetical protein